VGDPSGLGGTDSPTMPYCYSSIVPPHGFLDPGFRDWRVTRYGDLRRTDLNPVPLSGDEVDIKYHPVSPDSLHGGDSLRSQEVRRFHRLEPP